MTLLNDKILLELQYYLEDNNLAPELISDSNVISQCLSSWCNENRIDLVSELISTGFQPDLDYLELNKNLLPMFPLLWELKALDPHHPEVIEFIFLNWTTPLVESLIKYYPEIINDVNYIAHFINCVNPSLREVLKYGFSIDYLDQQGNNVLMLYFLKIGLHFNYRADIKLLMELKEDFPIVNNYQEESLTDLVLDYILESWDFRIEIYDIFIYLVNRGYYSNTIIDEVLDMLSSELRDISLGGQNYEVPHFPDLIINYNLRPTEMEKVLGSKNEKLLFYAAQGQVSELRKLLR